MKVYDFSLQQTLECGQCFNFEKLAENEYAVMAKGRVLIVSQSSERNSSEPYCFPGESELDFKNADEEEIRDIWVPYFDLDRDYDKIKSELITAEPRLESVIKKYGGIRILNQDFTETLLSFVISQNKNIPQIKKIIRSICLEYGQECQGTEYKTFPGRDELKKMSEEDFRDLKCGFRAPYLINAINADLDGNELRNMTYDEAKAKLTEIKGVGDKVANCVLLFSLGFRSAFPVDVWIKRIMEEMYFGCDTDKKVIEAFAADKFGKWGGYAQQYLFMYAREGMQSGK